MMENETVQKNDDEIRVMLKANWSRIISFLTYFILFGGIVTLFSFCMQDAGQNWYTFTPRWAIPLFFILALINLTLFLIYSIVLMLMCLLEDNYRQYLKDL